MIVLLLNYNLPGIYFEPTLFQGHLSLKLLTNNLSEINIHCKCQKQLNFIFIGPLNFMFTGRDKMLSCHDFYFLKFDKVAQVTVI